MSLEALAIHFGLINYAVVSILSLQAYGEELQGQQTLAKISISLFILATLSTSLALSLYLPRLAYDLIAARALILASSLSWLALGAYFLLRMRPITAFVAPLATLILFLHFFVNPPTSQAENQPLPSVFLAFHIAGATMGQILALAASIISVLYLWQQRVLKRKLLAQLTSRMPALDILEKIMVACLWTGFLFLTAALISGALYIQLYHAEARVLYSQKIAWALTVWMWYLSTLLARNVLSISVKRVAQMSLIGFVLLAVTFFGLIFFRTGGSGELG